MASLGLLGVPSSSAAHWPGQEKAPEALRAAGLTTLLAETGHRVVDHGDRPVARWRPHSHQQRRPHDLDRTLEVLRDTRSQVVAISKPVRPRSSLVANGEPDGSTARTLATGLAAALGRRSAGTTDPS